MSKKGALDQLQRSIPALMTVVVNRLSITGSIAYFRTAGIGIMEFRAMRTLALGESLRAVQIAKAIGLDKSAVSRTLRSLQQRALVVSSTRPGSRRLDYSLSAEGQTVYKNASVIARKRHDLLLEGITEEEREHLRGLLSVMLDNTRKLKALTQELKSGTVPGKKRTIRKQRRSGKPSQRSAL